MLKRLASVGARAQRQAAGAPGLFAWPARRFQPPARFATDGGDTAAGADGDGDSDGDGTKPHATDAAADAAHVDMFEPENVPRARAEPTSEPSVIVIHRIVAATLFTRAMTRSKDAGVQR